MKTTVKDRQLKYKSFSLKVASLNDKGIVEFYGAVFNNKDRAGDIIRPGAFKKTLSENFDEIQHYLNHGYGNNFKSIGMLISGKEDATGVLFKSQLMLGTTDADYAYEYYKASEAAGKAVRHSIGYKTIKGIDIKDESGRYMGEEIQEAFAGETSTLTMLAANPLAVVTSVKSMFNDIPFEELITEEQFFSKLLNAKFADLELMEIEKLKNHLDVLIKERTPGTFLNERLVKAVSENFKITTK